MAAKKRSKKPGQPSGLKYVERTHNRAGQLFLYYRRAGQRIPLRTPEGSNGFHEDYAAAAARFDGKVKTAGKTVDDAITEYLVSADFRRLREGSREDYRRVLDRFRKAFGRVKMADVDDSIVDDIRSDYADKAIAWNSLRSRMIAVERLHKVRHKAKATPWRDSKRLKPPKSNAHRPWPPEVLLAVMRAATPEFRALLIGYLLTAQRGSDVTTWGPDHYDAPNRLLRFEQIKTGKEMVLHVPETLARTLDAMAGKAPGRLFVTPRGKAWTTLNAQEAMRALLRHLGLARFTLHGLRATGPTALKMLGFENRAIRGLTGHESDANLETYLRGADEYALAKPAQEALEQAFAAVLADAEDGANARSYSGVTGKAAAKARNESANTIANSPKLPTIDLRKD